MKPGLALRSSASAVAVCVAAAPELVHAELKRVLTLSEARQTFTNIGAEVWSSSPDEFAALIAAELTKYAKLVKDAGVKLD